MGGWVVAVVLIEILILISCLVFHTWLLRLLLVNSAFAWPAYVRMLVYPSI